MTWKVVACMENRAPPRATVSFEPRLGVSKVRLRVTDSIWTASYIYVRDFGSCSAAMCTHVFSVGGRHKTTIVPVGQ